MGTGWQSVTPAHLVSCVEKGIDARLEMAHNFAGVRDDSTRRVQVGALRIDTFPKDAQVQTAAGYSNFDVIVGHRRGGGKHQVRDLDGGSLVASRKDGCRQERVDVVVVVFRRGGRHPVRHSAGGRTGWRGRRGAGHAQEAVNGAIFNSFDAAGV